MIRTPDSVIIRNSGLDAFFFLRYLRTVLKIFIPLSLTIIPILTPLNLLDGKDRAGGVQGLDRLSWANVGLTHTKLYWAHLVMALGVIVFICHTIYAELLEYTRIRQAHFTSSQYRYRVSSKTILVTDIPQEYLSTVALTSLYGAFPGGIRTIWFNRDVSNLSRKIQQRRRVVSMLETAETKLMAMATSSFHKQSNHEFQRTKESTLRDTPTGSTSPLWRLFLDDKDRDCMRLPIFGLTWMPSIPFLGRSVDTIDHCWQEMARLNNEIDQDQQRLARLNNCVNQDQQYPLENSAFVQFNTQVAALMACQSVVHHAPLQLRAQYVGISPRDVNWKSLSLPWWNRYARTMLAAVAIALLIIAWTLPIALTGVLSQISYLTGVLPWLICINRLPGWLLGCIQGILPQVILTVLIMVLPIIFRVIVNYQGLLTKTAVELSLQIYYFTFLFVQVFLTVSLSSSVTTIVQEVVHGLDSVPAVLARSLPKASNYFFSYILLHGFSVSAGALIQVRGLINWIILAPLMDRTPRQKQKRQLSLPQMEWGVIFPIYANLACIGKLHAKILVYLLSLHCVRNYLFSHRSIDSSLQFYNIRLVLDRVPLQYPLRHRF